MLLYIVQPSKNFSGDFLFNIAQYYCRKIADPLCALYRALLVVLTCALSLRKNVGGKKIELQ